MSDKKLKVGELIAKLQKFDPEGEIEVAVNTNTQRYPSAYVPIISADFVSQQQFRVGSQSDSRLKSICRISVWLHEGQSISSRKVG